MSNDVNKFTDRLVTETEAAKLLGFSKNTLRAWRVTGRPRGALPPQFLKCGRAVRYRLSELLVWMDEQPNCLSTCDAGARQ